MGPYTAPAVDGQFGSAVTVLAPIQDSRLLLSDGLVGSVNGTYLDGQETLVIHQGRYYNEYDASSERYIGLHRTIPISKGETENTAWAVAIMIPQDSYAAYTAEVQRTWVIAALGLLMVLLAISFFLARRFVRPITDSLKRFQQEGLPEQGLSSGISEVDELAEFLNARARNQRLEQGELPPNIAELFDQFVERKDLLTEAERNILRYYIDGHEIADIPDLAFISMSTVRKHNRSIYEKLQPEYLREAGGRLPGRTDALHRSASPVRTAPGAILIFQLQYSKAHKTNPLVLCAFSIIQWIPFVKNGKKYLPDHIRTPPAPVITGAGRRRAL